MCLWTHVLSDQGVPVCACVHGTRVHVRMRLHVCAGVCVYKLACVCKSLCLCTCLGSPPTSHLSSSPGRPLQAIVAMLRREVLLTRAKLHCLVFEQLQQEKLHRTLKAQLRMVRSRTHFADVCTDLCTYVCVCLLACTAA